MHDRRIFTSLLTLVVALVGCGGDETQQDPDPNPVTSTKEEVGKLLFFDENLSEPAGQACASCHAPGFGFTEPDQNLPVSQGVDPNLVGNRNAPSAAYASFSPPFHYDTMEGLYVGGQFWDGRAATLADQAKGPFLNPLEMRNPDSAAVVAKVQKSTYADKFEAVFGKGIFDDPNKAYDAIAEAIAAYESTPEVSPFSSKYDLYLEGKAELTPQELNGLALFEDEMKGNCAACHPSQKGPNGEHPLFTDFTYDNLGVPRNPSLPFYKLPPEYNPAGDMYVDMGLGGQVMKQEENGKFKVPTLRNIGVTGPYAHNGFFTSLRDVVDFYNSRDVPDKMWPAPEVADNVNKMELGNLGLTDAEIDDITAFMMTLTDGYTP